MNAAKRIASRPAASAIAAALIMSLLFDFDGAITGKPDVTKATRPKRRTDVGFTTLIALEAMKTRIRPAWGSAASFRALALRPARRPDLPASQVENLRQARHGGGAEYRNLANFVHDSALLKSAKARGMEYGSAEAFVVGSLETIASPQALLLVGELATLGIMLAGIAVMFRAKHLATRLGILSVAALVVPFLVSAGLPLIRVVAAKDNEIHWILLPIVAVTSAIVVLLFLQLSIALMFGREVANRVIADLISWLLKGMALVVFSPLRWLRGLTGR